MNKLPRPYYQSNDVVRLARDLIGKKLCTNTDGHFTSGIITETEAYHRDERACHAYLDRRTKRTEVMFKPGGLSYVYLCYGIHHLFNIITGGKDEVQAVLIRAIEPVDGVETMLSRRNRESLSTIISSGPGTLTQALGITTTNNGLSLEGDEIWLEEGETVSENDIQASTRIGVKYAGEDALLPWRFYLKTSDYVSRR